MMVTTPDPLIGGTRRSMAMLIALGLLCVMGPAQATQERPTWVPSDDLLADLPRLMDEAFVPGVSMAVVEDGRVVWKRHFGVANNETGDPITDDSVFEAASMSKPVFAYLVLQLADAGLIDLNRPLVEYYRPDFVSDHPFVELITAKDVLRHTTGLPNWRQPDVSELTPSFKPGTDYSYSGQGYVWLQLVVRRTTGMSLDQLAQTKLFGPTGMQHSSFVWGKERQENQVWGHVSEGDRAGGLGFQFRREFFGLMLTIAERNGEPLPTWNREDELRAHIEMRKMPELHPAIASAGLRSFRTEMNLLHNAAAGLGTTAEDYARFMILMMDRHRHRSWELSDAARRSMIDRQSMHTPGVTDQAFGWRAEDTPQGRIIFHGGNNGDVFKCFSVMHPANGLGIVILTNSGGGDKLYKHIVERVTRLNIKYLDDIDDLVPGEDIGDARAIENASVFPGREWESWPDAASAGFDQAVLDEARRYIIDELNTTGLLVSVGGRVLMEYGDIAELSYIASCRKSVLGTLYGRYVESGVIDLDSTLGELGIDDVEELLDIERNATVRNLLASRSGVYHPASNPGSTLVSAPSRGTVEPGSRFLYSNWDFNAAGTVLERCAGISIYDALEQDLAVPIRMQDFDRAAQRKSGDISVSLHPAYHMWLSARDMARIGLLMLHRGRWGATQVIPEAWVDEILTPITRSGETGPNNAPLGYGLMWWLWDGDANTGAFKGAFTARGHFGQFITVLPALDMVVAHKTKLAYDRPTDGGDYFGLLLRLADAVAPD